MFDQQEERFDVLIPRSRLKGERILVKAVDACGNEQSASVPLGEGAPKRR